MRHLYILTTGGTIEKTYDESDGSLENRDSIIRDTILRRLRLPYTSLEVKGLMAKDSLEMDDQDRLIIYNAIRSFEKYGSPIVVLHGTDTMEQTVKVCFEKTKMDGPIKVPVIFTGAMKPLGFESSDADQNIIEALFAAKIVEPGIYITFHGELFKAPHVRKNKAKRTFERTGE
jgi:L-asparaginase